MHKRSIITVAVGKPYYLKLAENLLRSFLLWNKTNDINFLLLTDNPEFFTKYIHLSKVNIKHLHLAPEDQSFIAKFFMYEHSTAIENLFIDSDCIIYGDLTPVFEKMNTQDFTVIGNDNTTGNFFCDVPTIMQKFKINYLPKFVGSVYFYKRNDVTHSIFKQARLLKTDYDSLGFIRLRGKENEEPLFAVAMAMFKQKCIPDDGFVKADSMFFSNCATNVLKGRAHLHNKKEVLNIEYCQLMTSEPLIVHYNDSYSERSCYLAEQYRLTRIHSGRHNTELIVYLKYLLPERITNVLKRIFRPIYHRLFGPLNIKKNKRVK